MTFLTSTEDQSIEKNALVVLRPKQRTTGWTQSSGNVWVVDFDLGPVNRLWAKAGEEFTKVTVMPTSPEEFWHDEDNGLLYAYLDTNTGTPGSSGPEDTTSSSIVGSFQNVYGPCALGMTAEFELYLATRPFQGPRDPTDSASDPVEWRGVLKEGPHATQGSVQQLYGFNPLEESPLAIANADGWMLPYLYDCSFNLCTVRSFIMADEDLERAVSEVTVREVFRGYGGQPKLGTDGTITIPCYDLLALLDRPANPPQRLSSTEFTLVDPAAVRPGQEWFIRRVRGMVDDFEPVNIDFSSSPSTSNNRDFLTHEGTGTDGGWGANVDDANPGNSGTRTYLTTTPKCNVGDTVIIIKGGVDRYTTVTSVNRASNYFDHGAIAGAFAPGDSVLRFFIGWVKVQDFDGNWWDLSAGTHFSRINKATLGNTPDWLGFRLIDNWEAAVGFPETFDPSKHRIVCRVYGTTVLDTYADAVTDVGAVVNDGGIAAESVSLLHWLLRQAGVENAMIDQSTFDSAATNHALGLAIPSSRSASVAPTWKDLIQLVLQSMIWKLVYLDASGEVLVGLKETAPFVASADYDADDVDFADFSFEHDYSAVYQRVAFQYGFKEAPREGANDIFYAAQSINVSDGTQVALGENYLARDLHESTATLEIMGLQYMLAQAQVVADRYAFALGDRRAFYRLALGPEFLTKATLGASYDVLRKQLPGYALDVDTYRTRQTVLVQSTKSTQGVNLVLEDQKGIQDNSGDW